MIRTHNEKGQRIEGETGGVRKRQSRGTWRGLVLIVEKICGQLQGLPDQSDLCVRVRLSWFKSQLCHYQLCVPDLTSPHFSFSICTMEIILVSTFWLIRQINKAPTRQPKRESQLLSRVQFCDPHGLQPTRLLCPWNSPGKDTRVGCQFLLQGIFPTEGLNPGLLHCRQILYLLSQQGSPTWQLFFIHTIHWWHCEKKEKALPLPQIPGILGKLCK